VPQTISSNRFQWTLSIQQQHGLIISSKFSGQYYRLREPPGAIDKFPKCCGGWWKWSSCYPGRVSQSRRPCDHLYFTSTDICNSYIATTPAPPSWNQSDSKKWHERPSGGRSAQAQSLIWTHQGILWCRSKIVLLVSIWCIWKIFQI